MYFNLFTPLLLNCFEYKILQKKSVKFQASLEIIELENAALWWAGKEMLRGKKLMDFVGKNEKTKIICKIQKVSTLK